MVWHPHKEWEEMHAQMKADRAEQAAIVAARSEEKAHERAEKKAQREREKVEEKERERAQKEVEREAKAAQPKPKRLQPEQWMSSKQVMTKQQGKMALADKLTEVLGDSWNPIVELARISADDTTETGHKISALKECAKYLFPQLKAVDLTSGGEKLEFNFAIIPPDEFETIEGEVILDDDDQAES